MNGMIHAGLSVKLACTIQKALVNSPRVSICEDGYVEMSMEKGMPLGYHRGGFDKS